MLHANEQLEEKITNQLIDKMIRETNRPFLVMKPSKHTKEKILIGEIKPFINHQISWWQKLKWKLGFDKTLT